MTSLQRLTALISARSTGQALDMITRMVDKFPALRAPYEKARRTMTIKEAALIALQGCQESTIAEALAEYDRMGSELAP